MIQILSALLGYFARVPMAMVRGWDRFFFTPTDPVMLGWIRILVGSVLFYIHVSSAPFVLDFIGPEAWVDEEVYAELHDLRYHPKHNLPGNVPQSQGDIEQVQLKHRFITPYGFSIWFLINDPFWVKVTYYAGIVCVGLFTLGFCTRVTGILSWAFHLSYLHRSMMIWFGMDAMMSFMMLYLCVGPSGSVVSIDSWIRRKRAGGAASPVITSWSANLALRLMQVHMCVVYFIAGIAKLQGSSWWNGHATWLTMNSPMFNEGLDIGWLADPRMGEWFWHYFCFITTYTTLAFEITFPFLIWNRYLRPWMLFLAFMLHAGIGIFMGLGGFGLVMLAGCMSFIPASGMRWVMKSLWGERTVQST